VPLTAPSTIGELTPAWLEAALRERFPGVLIRDLAASQPLYGTATKIRLTIDYQHAPEGAPSSLIVKGGFAAHREAMAYLYAHETRFYREIQPELGINTPCCYATIDDFSGHQHILLLEDLDLSHAKFCRVQHPLTYTQAQGFLGILARLHARTWNRGMTAPGGTLQDLKIWEALPAPDHGGAYAHGQLVPETWTQYMRLPRCLAVPRIFHDRTRMQAGLEALNLLCLKEPRCLLHADFHLGNLYFDAAGQPGVLDWQSYSRGHWSHDVTYFMVSALDPADRRRWDAALVSYYLQKLHDEGVAAPPTLDEAMQAFRLQIIDGLFYWMMNPPEWQSEENNCSVAPRFAHAALDHESFDAF
jgi:hypothetical protein